MKQFLFIISLLIVENQYAQSYNLDSLISIIIKDIEKEQIKEQGEFYPGMFYSFRGAAVFPHNFQPDNNIFFTAIGSFTLKYLKKDIAPKHQIVIDSILAKSSRSFLYYQNKNGLPLYNFWPTGGKIMPHSFIAQHLTKQFTISEDADDTVMILMSLLNNDSSNNYVKKRLEEVSNQGSAGKQIRSTYKRFREYNAYTTYLGYKMQSDFDFSVQCNILYFNYAKKMTLGKQDSATLQLLSSMIKERLYMKRPRFISPYYGRPSLILYHLTRLMARFHPAELESYKPIIIEDVRTLLSTAKTPLERVLLSTSLLRLGARSSMPSEREVQTIRWMDQHKFSFFQARPAYWCRPWLKSILLHAEGVNYNFFSPTYDKILLLENLVLHQKNNTPTSY